MSKTASRIISIIVAAGEGRRLGSNKALLEVAGVPALTRPLSVTQDSRVGDTIVVTGSRGAEVATLAAAHGSRHTPNPNWQRGMTTSIQAGIRALPVDCLAFLIQPVDHVLTTAADLDALVEAFAAHGTPDLAILRPRHDALFGHPVLFARSYGDEFLALNDDQPGHTVYRRHRSRVTAIPVANPHIRMDLDTPEDLQRAEAILRAAMD